MCYWLSRIISDLRLGFCFAIEQNSRKTFFFCLDVIVPEIYNVMQHNTILTTTEYYNFHTKNNVTQNVICKTDLSFIRYANEEENLAIQIVKTAELIPVILISNNESEIKVPHEIIKLSDAQQALKNFQNELYLVSKSYLPTNFAKTCEIYIFGSRYGGFQHYAIVVNNALSNDTPTVRVHSSCYTGDLLSSLRCDCRDQLLSTLEEMNKTSGILLYLMQEGRGIGLANKIKAYHLQQTYDLDTVESNLALGFNSDERSFVPAVKMLEFFEKNKIILITNNPDKANNLAKHGIDVIKTIPTIITSHEYNVKYLKTKQSKMMHQINIHMDEFK